MDRRRGPQGSEDINQKIARMAIEFLKTTHVQAQTCLHRFPMAALLLSKIPQGAVCVPASRHLKAIGVYQTAVDMLHVVTDVGAA